MEKIEFIIPSYKRKEKLITLLWSLVSQTSQNWEAHVVADAPYEGLDDIKEMFKENDKIRFSTLNGPHRDWGHTARNYGLENSRNEWLVMTGDDNYYMPMFVEFFLEKINTNIYDFVYCDLVHNWLRNDYIHLKSQPVVGRIDIGNFASRRSIIGNQRLQHTLHVADGLFVEEYLKKTNKIVHINKILYVHN